MIPRGNLIRFRAKDSRGVFCRWDAISHGDGTAHKLNGDRNDTFVFSPMSTDRPRRIRFGFIIEREFQ